MNHCCWSWCKRKKEGRAGAKSSTRTVHCIRSLMRRGRRHCLWILQGARIKKPLNLNSGLNMGKGRGMHEAWWVLWQTLFSDSIRINLWIVPAAPGSACGISEYRGWDANSSFSITFSSWRNYFSKHTCYKSFLKLSPVWGLSSMLNTNQTQVETQPAQGINLRVKVSLKPIRNVPHT